ncbi:hypothetical protein [Paenibacillus polymyxa]|uniref:hypothetical protein n=1 Tax=Paenibacillus polymyxa TaxID=1406 RepID=UPI00129B91A4|nr:hypothetical protein [Paenibacillus polymyxa]KAE8559124.1 hypothetical protein BJH92_16050 [Paenibacillus polymyxa]MCJ1222252.1 hypothetical protein [Paenibacillus polymyxa]
MDKKIQEIREALEAATPGRWFVMHGSDVAVEEPPGSGEIDIVLWANRHKDAEFLAKAPEYISYLLQQIEIKDKELGFYVDNGASIGRLIDSEHLKSITTRIARAALKGEDTNE